MGLGKVHSLQWRKILFNDMGKALKLCSSRTLLCSAVVAAVKIGGNLQRAIFFFFHYQGLQKWFWGNYFYVFQLREKINYSTAADISKAHTNKPLVPILKFCQSSCGITLIR